MFSVPKLVVLAVIIAVIWYGFKIFSRGQQASKKDDSGGNVSPGNSGGSSDAVNMVQCSVCGDFVAGKGATNCGKENCPYPGA